MGRNQLLYSILHLISHFWFRMMWMHNGLVGPTSFYTYLFEDVGLGHQVSQDAVTEVCCFQIQVVFMLCCAIDYC